MKKGIIALVIVILLGFFGYNMSIGFYNDGIEKYENAKTEWSKVESAYQRRNDLIGNLVNTVQGAADFERETLKDVVEARAKATAATVNANDLTPEKLAAFQDAQTGVTSALSRLLVTVERYPDLKANENFLALQSQLEGTENRINMARNNYNEGVGEYAKHIKKFPGNLLAGMMGLEDDLTRYEAEVGAEKPVDVEFDFNQ